MLQLTDEQRVIYRNGADDALKFRADPYRDLNQDVFKAETAGWALWLTYDDVTGEYDLRVKFKRPQGDREASTSFDRFSDAMARTTRFIAEHPAPRPQCFVDY